MQARVVRNSVANIVSSVALAIAVGGCLEPTDLAPPLETHAQPIVGGIKTGDYPAVALLKFVKPDGGTSSCSATLIAPRVILTAAHCLTHDFTPTREYAYFGSHITDPDDPYYIDAIDIIETAVVPGWQVVGSDFGLGYLERAPATAPMPIYRDALGSDAIGMDLVLVGWGKTSFDGGGAGTKRMATATLAAFGASDSLLYGDANGTACQGDSGGPLLATINGQEVIIGVNAFLLSFSDCNGMAGANAIHTHRDFIDEFLASHDNGTTPVQPDWPSAVTTSTVAVTSEELTETPQVDAGEELGDDPAGCSTGRGTTRREGAALLALIAMPLVWRRRPR